MIATIIFWAFVVWVAAQCLYAVVLFLRTLLPDKQILPDNENQQPVSIIICARNEADNLKKYLPLILAQDYHDKAGQPMYEVVVVNDCSDDDTAGVLEQLSMQHSHLNTTSVLPWAKRTFKGKKYPLSIGVHHARHNWLLLTDADCKPASNKWLQLMVAPMTKGKEIVAGYGGYFATGAWLNAFTRWEAMHAYVQMKAYSLVGLPYMAVGRNMACTRQIMATAQQSEVWGDSASGDDDLLVNIAGTNKNYAIAGNPAAFTYTASEQNFNRWVTQKQRHLTDGKSYRKGVMWLLATYGFTYTATWFYFFALLLTHLWPEALVVMAVRCVLYWMVWAVAAMRLQDKKLIPAMPLYDAAWMLYNFIFLPYILIKSKQNWR